MGETENFPTPIRSPKGFHHYQISGLVCETSLLRNLNGPETHKQDVGRRSGEGSRGELRENGFLAKTWYKNSWTDLVLPKDLEPYHLENISSTYYVFYPIDQEA